MAKINQEQTRDFEYIYYKDLGRALDKATTVALSGPTTLNIGTGVIVTFDDLVATAEKLLPKLQVEIIPGTKTAFFQTAHGGYQSQTSLGLGGGI